MKKLLENKYLIGAAIIFWLSLYCVVSLQTNVEARNKESFNSEININVK